MIYKRCFDIIFSLFLIFILFPLMIIISLLIRMETKGPAIFFSKRIGKNNKIFLMPKFRTMKKNTPQVATHLLKDSSKYVTKIGIFLRKSSLDEIPQIFSILIGHMSFVGPRPALFNQYDLKKLREKENIHLLTPGLTGWAQINGRDEISIQDKVQIEVYYKKNQSMLLDCKILLLTIFRVFKMNNIKH